MNRTLRSHKKNNAPNTIGITGRELSMQMSRFYIPECFKTDGDSHIFLDHKDVYDPALLPKEVLHSTTDILKKSGTYTWILTKVKDRFEVVGSRTYTEYEIGSKHRDLYFDAGEPTVYAAGECQVILHPHEVEVIYNLESGTFMKDMMEEFKWATNIQKSPTNYYKSFMDKMWVNAGATIVRYTEDTLISKLPKKLTKSVIEGYRRAGYIPYKFNSQVECDLYKVWHLSKYKMGETRDFLTYIKEEFSALPEEYVKDPNVFTKGGKRTLQTRKRKRTNK